MVHTDKLAVVTGGSRGIGYQIAKIFLENGIRVLAVSRDQAKLAQAREELPDLLTLQADVSVATDVDRMATWVQDNWGRLDILVNNAGISPSQGADLTGQPDEVFESTLRVNVIGPYLCTKRLLPSLLRAENPRVVNVGSISGIISPRLSGAYGVSKTALHALTIASANALQGKVAVNAMSPGFVKTDMAPNAPGDPSDSAETALWLVAQPWELTGKFFRGKAEVGWTPLEIVDELARVQGSGSAPRD